MPTITYSLQPNPLRLVGRTTAGTQNVPALIALEGESFLLADNSTQGARIAPALYNSALDPLTAIVDAQGLAVGTGGELSLVRLGYGDVAIG